MEKLFSGEFAIEPFKARDAGQTSRALGSMDPWLTLKYSPEALSYYLLHADSALDRYSVLVGDRVSGVFSVRFPWLLGPFIELLALFDDCRGKGIGRKIVDWIAGQFPPSANIWTTVSSFNVDAQRFYTRVGFERTATLDDLIRPGFQEILLRKRPSALRPVE